jgi:hypothetical protein
MANKSLTKNNLEEQILLLQKELDEILQKTGTFEALLRARLSDLIIETQELYVLYKQQKRAKKEIRLEQKKRGKNYQEPVGLKVIAKKEKEVVSTEHQKEKKRLYREAMLQVHPDKFFMKEDETDLATELTAKLIEIYKTESLETLQAFHAHIFAGNTAILPSKSAGFSSHTYLQLEVEKLQKAIEVAQNDQLHKVLSEYENPLAFADELKQYYEHRIVQLKKRTRKKL